MTDFEIVTKIIKDSGNCSEFRCSGCPLSDLGVCASDKATLELARHWLSLQSAKDASHLGVDPRTDVRSIMTQLVKDGGVCRSINSCDDCPLKLGGLIKDCNSESVRQLAETWLRSHPTTSESTNVSLEDIKFVTGIHDREGRCHVLNCSTCPLVKINPDLKTGCQISHAYEVSKVWLDQYRHLNQNSKLVSTGKISEVTASAGVSLSKATPARLTVVDSGVKPDRIHLGDAGSLTVGLEPSHEEESIEWGFALKKPSTNSIKIEKETF